MKRAWLFLFLNMSLVSCGSSTNPGNSSVSLSVAGSNVLTLTVGSSAICGQSGSINVPCTSVTICVPNTTNCQIVSDILVDTGSTGLRVFASAVSGLALPQVKNTNSQLIAECAQFGSGEDWGPIVLAGVKLASEATVQAEIQLINQNFATAPSDPNTGCPNGDTSPAQAGFNGILGVGLMQEDCGSTCVTPDNSAPGGYYACTAATPGSHCTLVGVANNNQLQNPVSLLSADNNGVMIVLPSVPQQGVSSATGALVLGIATQANNTPSGTKTYAADSFGNFITVFNNQTMNTSFIDSGSNGLFFPKPSSLSTCSASDTFYCSATQTFTATNKAWNSSNSGSLNFTIVNANTLPNTGGADDLGGESVALSGQTGYFDWGLPFFYGRNVYVGIAGKSATGVGTGPYWAY